MKIISDLLISVSKAVRQEARLKVRQDSLRLGNVGVISNASNSNEQHDMEINSACVAAKEDVAKNSNDLFKQFDVLYRNMIPSNFTMRLNANQQLSLELDLFMKQRL
ncbi:hypothetical protein HN51_004978 [Arachis hypogaea]